MVDGLTVHDAALEIEAAALEALVARRSVSVTVRRLDATLTPAALNGLLAVRGGPAGSHEPGGPQAPMVEVAAGRATLRIMQHDGRALEVNLEAPGLRCDFTSAGIRVVTTEG